MASLLALLAQPDSRSSAGSTDPETRWVAWAREAETNFHSAPLTTQGHHQGTDVITVKHSCLSVSFPDLTPPEVGNNVS